MGSWAHNPQNSKCKSHTWFSLAHKKGCIFNAQSEKVTLLICATADAHVTLLICATADANLTLLICATADANVTLLTCATADMLETLVFQRYKPSPNVCFSFLGALKQIEGLWLLSL